MKYLSIFLLACAGPEGGPVAGAADTHCDGVTPQTVDPSVCGTNDETLTTGATSSDYGPTHDGSVADDDDCKYHVAWTSTPLRQNTNVTFTVDASYLATGDPITGLDTSNAVAEVYLNDTHPAPPTAQVVSQPSPGVITFGPIQFDEKGTWTVRFHFFETCDDSNPASPHGHTAFYMDVP